MKTWSPPFTGIWPAMITPYDAEGHINLQALRRLVARFIEEGAAGIYLCGSTAEAPLLRIEERKAIAECVIHEVARQIPVMVHVGQTAPVLSLELAQHADRAGADAISSTLPPFFAYTPAQIAMYWNELALVSDLPFYGYVMHEIGQSFSAVEQWFSAVRKVPTLVGLKFTNESAYQLALLKQCSGGALNILSGADQSFLACKSQGADGAIGTSYNVALPAWRQVDQLHINGDGREASELMMRCAELVGRFNKSFFLSRVKAVLFRQGIDCGKVRSPLCSDHEIPPGELDELYHNVEKLRNLAVAGAPG